MCRTPLTAHRSEAFTIKKGGHGREEEGMPGRRDRPADGKTELGVPSCFEDCAELSGTSNTDVKRAGGRAKID